MANHKISVIIPVYNAENYIISCLESVMNQSFSDIEVICVNDGSKDGSKELIEAYMRSNPRIMLINQANQGVSMARNIGLQAASGDYIGFVDADDTIDASMYDTLYRAAVEGDCDAVITNFECELEGCKVTTKFPFPLGIVLMRDYIEREIMTYFLKSDQLNTVWNKLYKRSAIIDFGVEFPRNVALGEDGMFNMQFFKHAKRVTYLDYSGYNYRAVIGSATRNMKEKDYFQRALDVYRLDLTGVYTNEIDPLKLKQLRSFKLITNVIATINMYLRASKDVGLAERLRYVNRMIKNSDVREALPYYYHEASGTLSRYERFIAEMIRRKSILGLYCATTYSKLRNT
ncbi:glycosyltransferase family 2 protein [Paenibacillus allorhizoplanae]|nr:glycosyltransferase [Paenibacillus allorhizoplanae]